MLDVAPFHPQIVHFTIALLFVGVIARVLSFVPLGERFRFLSPAAAVLVILGSLAAVMAAQTGVAAHSPVERIPGARDAVVNHEDWGKRTQNVFIVVGLLEIAGLAVRRPKLASGMRVAAAVVGVVGLLPLYEAGEHGGELVYSYAGGVGTRSGDAADVERLLIAALYNQAIKDREAGRPDHAAGLVEELVRRHPDNRDIKFLAVESRLGDRKDPKGALAALDSISVPLDETRLVSRLANLRADIFLAMGRSDSARAMIEHALTVLPGNPRLKARLDSLTKG